MRKHYSVLLMWFIVISMGYGVSWGNYLDMNDPMWVGTEEIREGEYKKALKKLQRNFSYSDTAFRYFKLGVVYHGLEDWSRAMFYYRLCIQKEKFYVPFVYEKIGEMDYQRGKYEDALKAFRVAADKTQIKKHQRLIYRQMYDMSKEHAEIVGEIQWLNDLFDVNTDVQKDQLYNKLVSIHEKKEYKSLEEIFNRYVSDGKTTGAQQEIGKYLREYTGLSKYLSTDMVYKISRLHLKLGHPKVAASWLSVFLKRNDYKKNVANSALLHHRMMINYRLKQYKNAIKYGLEYNKKYKLTPYLAYILARSYRFSGDGKKAAYWYDTHVKKFPRNSRTRNILWYRAWQQEDGGNYTGARATFKRLFSGGGKLAKSQDSYFRYALTYSKQKNYKSAIKAFSDLIKKYPYSYFSIGAHYWRAKSYFALKDYKNAKKDCQFLIDNYPSRYYGYRAQEMIKAMGGRVRPLKVETSFSTKEVRQWLDAIFVEKDTLSEYDRFAFDRSKRLAAVGMIEYADFYSAGLGQKYVKNLLFQYDLSQMYGACGNPAKAFRTAHRLLWRIPEKFREKMPIQIYGSLYPNYYDKYIRKEAKKNGVEHELVRAIIRQESIFNHKISSPVGARGLMQIMPYTGKEISEDLKDPTYHHDSLYVAPFNIRYGTYYIKKVLSIFEDDKEFAKVLAIASYNGGPHNAKKWKKQNGKDEFDMFIEDIGFSETRKYVKKVLANYWTYKQLQKHRRHFKE